MHNDVSLMAVVKNEEKNIRKMLHTVHSFVKQKIIIDTGSIDDTAKICREEFGIDVINKEFPFDEKFFINSKNYALNLCECDWVLVLDGDEEPSYELSEEILNFVHNEDYDCLRIRRLNFFKYHPSSSDSVIRLFRRSAGYKFYVCHVLPHDTPALNEKFKLGRVMSTNNPIYHWAWYDITKEEYLFKKELKNNTLLPEALKKQFSDV